MSLFLQVVKTRICKIIHLKTSVEMIALAVNVPRPLISHSCMIYYYLISLLIGFKAIFYALTRLIDFKF